MKTGRNEKKVWRKEEEEKEREKNKHRKRSCAARRLRGVKKEENWSREKKVIDA